MKHLKIKNLKNDNFIGYVMFDTVNVYAVIGKYDFVVQSIKNKYELL